MKSSPLDKYRTGAPLYKSGSYSSPKHKVIHLETRSERDARKMKTIKPYPTRNNKSVSK